MKDKQNLIKLWIKKIVYVLLFNLRQVIHIPSFCIVKLLCCGGHLSNDITFIGAKGKYKSSYLLDVSQPYLQNHIRMSLGRPGDVSEGRRQGTSPGVAYRTIGNVHRTSYFNVMRTLVEYVPWRYIEHHMGHPQDGFQGCPKDVLGT